MKAIVGTAPNLPWWHLKNMTEKEIEEFNRGHMVEVEMSDDKALDKNHDFESKAVVDAWNAAIDKCIEVANKYDSYGPAYEMRMLKK